MSKEKNCFGKEKKVERYKWEQHNWANQVYGGKLFNAIKMC